jgi:hypothetical protein
VEWQFVPNWSVFFEYNFLGFQRDSDFTCGPNICGNDVFTAKANIQPVLVGVDYRFGGIGKGKAPYYMGSYTELFAAWFNRLTCVG